jgi:hypothetical protein
MIQVTLREAKGSFFDRQMVVSAVDRATHAALRKGGAYIRAIMRNLIRSAGRDGRASMPGQPPRSQTGRLKDHIVFVQTTGTFGGQGVWIGPALLDRGNGAPETLEYGGVVRLPRGALMRSARTGRVHPGPARTIRIAPRPYLGPALDRAIASGKLPDMWRNAALGGGR